MVSTLPGISYVQPQSIQSSEHSVLFGARFRSTYTHFWSAQLFLII